MNKKKIIINCVLIVLCICFMMISVNCENNIYSNYSFYNSLFFISVGLWSISCIVLLINLILSIYKSKLNKVIKIILILISIIFSVLISPLGIITNVYSNIYNQFHHDYEITVDKPMIYLYPESETNVKVTLENSNLLTTTYPKYNNGWEVVASSNGNLYDLKTNRNYYGLYWEGKRENVSIKSDGFIVKGEDPSKFLEEKLSLLGLNEKEINEFIVYWLPKLESNKYNYIRFESIDEINSYMSLNIEPSPDTVIRVLMDYKGLDKPIKVKEQVIEKVDRIGFTVVEWGGTEIN